MRRFGLALVTSLLAMPTNVARPSGTASGHFTAQGVFACNVRLYWPLAPKSPTETDCVGWHDGALGGVTSDGQAFAGAAAPPPLDPKGTAPRFVLYNVFHHEFCAFNIAPLPPVTGSLNGHFLAEFQRADGGKTTPAYTVHGVFEMTWGYAGVVATVYGPPNKVGSVLTHVHEGTLLASHKTKSGAKATIDSFVQLGAGAVLPKPPAGTCGAAPVSTVVQLTGTYNVAG
jgi:hypothetical protein